jgi:hypothetical protein
LLVYVNPNADFRKYTQIMVEPVTVWNSAETATVPHKEAQRLADDLDDALRLALFADFTLVERAGPGVMRLRAAITEAEGSWHVHDAVASRFDKEMKAAKGTPSTATRDFVGKAGVEAEVLDALTGERLLAAVDRRAGARSIKLKDSTWEDVREAFDFWAERLRVRLARLRAGS